MDKKLTIAFDEANAAQANKLALDLQTFLVLNAEIESEIEKDSEHTQDIGTIVAFILGRKTFGILAKGLSDWMLKRQDRKITIKADGEIIGENLSSGDIKRILDSLK